MELENKVAVVTGSAVRIGRQLALALAQHGVRLVVHYLSSTDPAEEVVAEIKQLGGDAIAIRVDLRDRDNLHGLLDQATEHFGTVDILINNAAVFIPGDALNTTMANWEEHFDTNLKAPFFLSQAFARQLGGQRHGHIVNIADWRATRPRADYVAYTLTKSGLITMTQNLALALAPNIQVNAIAPGAILPPPGKDESYLDRLAQQIPVRRHGSPSDVAAAMLFLLQSDFITGELIFVTGGEHLS